MRTKIALAGVIFALASTADALAATVTLASTGGFVELAYDAAPGEVNDLQVGISAGTVTITDQGAVITVPAACTQANTHEAICPSIDGVSINLGNLDDTAVVTESQAGIVALNGGGGNDTITGGPKRDWILGRGGADIIAAGGGSDVLEPGSGDDQIDGGPGRDAIYYPSVRGGVVVDLREGASLGAGTKRLVGVEDVIGTNANDQLYGDTGSNLLSGADGVDVLFGRGGDDRLYGGAGRSADRLFGGAGSDRLVGSAGANRLVGNAGDDILKGGSGKDVLEGGLGNDKLRDRDGFRDLVRGGGGDDRARVDLGLDVTSSIETFF